MKRVKQRCFPWAEIGERRDANQVVIDPETAEVVVALMTRALIAVARAVEEADDER